MCGTSTSSAPDLPDLIDLIIRPGRSSLVDSDSEELLIREVGAASGRIGKDTITDPYRLRGALYRAQQAEPGQLLVSVNQESGRLDALDWPQVAQLPGSLALGAAGEPELAKMAGLAVAGQLRALGLTWNLAPVCDLAARPAASAVGTRAFGSDPEKVATLAAAYVRGLQRGGVAATAKHFPGLGGIAADPHDTAPVADRLTPGALLPFQAAVEAGVACVMVGSHTVRALDDRPALASQRVIRLLRDQLGFEGVVVSENLSIPSVNEPFGGLAEAAVAAVAAGVDLVMLDSEVSRGGQDFTQRARAIRRRAAVAQALAGAVSGGRIGRGRVEESAKRVLVLRRRFGLCPGTARPAWEEANAAAERAAERIATASVATVRGSHLLPLNATDAVAAVRVPDTRQRRADSARLAPDLLPAALGAHRPVLPATAGAVLPYGVGAVVIYGYDTRTADGGSAASTEAARWAGRGRTIVQVALGDPDDLAGSPADVLVAAFSPHRFSTEAVAAMLLGHGHSYARVPVRGATW